MLASVCPDGLVVGPKVISVAPERHGRGSGLLDPFLVRTYCDGALRDPGADQDVNHNPLVSPSLRAKRSEIQ